MSKDCKFCIYHDLYDGEDICTVEDNEESNDFPLRILDNLATAECCEDYAIAFQQIEQNQETK